MYDYESTLFAKLIDDCKNINDNYSFADLIAERKGRYDCRQAIEWYALLRDYIPTEYLYNNYKDLFCMIDKDKGYMGYYNDFFDKKTLQRLMSVNKHDTINNPVLSNLLDEKGYLTVYHGHCKKTMHNSNSWTLNKEVALFFGNRNARFNCNEQFYCVTGKVKLDDVIAYITDREEEEIVVLQRFVKRKAKEYFQFDSKGYLMPKLDDSKTLLESVG